MKQIYIDIYNTIRIPIVCVIDEEIHQSIYHRLNREVYFNLMTMMYEQVYNAVRNYKNYNIKV